MLSRKQVTFTTGLRGLTLVHDSKYVMGLRDWVAGNLDWSFASQRYFGKDHEATKETLMVNIYPHRMAYVGEEISAKVICV